MSEERVILADCCEDWIIDWGGFYAVGQAFACPEDATEWTKTAKGAYRRADGREFQLRSRRGPEAEFPYLASADGHEPNVERCCAKLLLAYGERLGDGPFRCPVDGSVWQKRTQRLHGLRVPVFAREGQSEPLTIQPGRSRPFLVALSEYSPPRE
ncbi:MAG: hypothetical protein HY071_06000 [Chloroflexi bacterium]|nr:hypothetical protein [Chloroflexota bacterium]